MRLTIIPSDGAVYEDSVVYSELTWEGTPVDVHALQWYDTYGNIEFVDASKPNEDITELPQWALNAQAAWEAADYAAKHPPAPTPEQIQAQNKGTAVSLLQKTDWTTIPDVADPTKSNPYLTNSNEFLAFRNIVRPIAINPPTTVYNFPAIPVDTWATV